MKTAISLSVIVFLLSLFSCRGFTDRVVLWKCDNSTLFLNRVDTCIKVPNSLSQYNLYLSIRHHDDFMINGIRFAVSVSSVDTMLCDTILLPLSDSLDCWDGIPYIGAYVKKVSVDMQLPSVDSAIFSITPLMSNAVEGVDWLALELKKNE